MSQETKASVEANKWLSFGILGSACLVVGGGIWWFLSDLLDSPPKPVKQVVQVQVFRPPPPPPPKVDEPPPPPEIQEEVEIPEPEPLPDIPDLPDAPPPDMLGLDAEGVAGSDAFGLKANRGGAGLVGSEGRYRWYAQRLKDQVNDFLAGEALLDNESFKVRVLIWVSEDGSVARISVKTLSGDAVLDQRLADALDKLGRFADQPPNGLPQPISLRIERNV